MTSSDTWSDEQIRTSVEEIVRALIGDSERELHDEDTLSGTLKIHSDDLTFDYVPQIVAIFGVNPPLAAWESITTIGDTVRLVVQMLDAQGRRSQPDEGGAGADRDPA